MKKNTGARDVEQLLDLRSLENELGRRRLRHFISLAWEVAEPARPFIPNWHIYAIADHLQAVSEGQIRRLVITVPPGHGKSLTVSVMWPAYQWLARPEFRGIFTSYDGELAMRDSVRCRALLASAWYQETFRPEWQFSGDQNEKSWFENDRKGFRMALGVGGKGTGFRGDCLVVDDPLNAKNQHSETALKEVIFWYDQVMSSRLNDPANGAMVIIMQRLSERDLAAHVLDRGGYEHLNLPTEYERDRPCVTVLGNMDPRSEDGRLLFPALFPRKVIDEAKLVLGSQGFAAQHQQRPAPAEGGIFKRWWWRFWKRANDNLPPITVRDQNGKPHEAVVVTIPTEVDEGIQSWDCSFKDLDTSDFVVGQVWGRLGADVYLLDQMRARLNLPATLDAIRQVSRKWPGVLRKSIEDQANGPAVVQCLAHELPGIIASRPLGSKVSRAAAITPMIEAGNIYLPHPDMAPWVDDFLEECASFPHGRHDDQVDAMTQALNQLNASWLVEVPAGEEDEDPYRFF